MDPYDSAGERLRPGQQHQAADLATLSGRNLEPWRAVLGVAHWLQERHDVEGLFDRMEQLSRDYQIERANFEEGDRVRILFRALLTLTLDSHVRTLTPKWAAISFHDDNAWPFGGSIGGALIASNWWKTLPRSTC